MTGIITVETVLGYAAQAMVERDAERREYAKAREELDREIECHRRCRGMISTLEVNLHSYADALNRLVDAVGAEGYLGPSPIGVAMRKAYFVLGGCVRVEGQ
jgi:hypothetical protein